MKGYRWQSPINASVSPRDGREESYRLSANESVTLDVGDHGCQRLGRYSRGREDEIV